MNRRGQRRRVHGERATREDIRRVGSERQMTISVRIVELWEENGALAREEVYVFTHDRLACYGGGQRVGGDACGRDVAYTR